MENLEKKVKEKPMFDSDMSPYSEVNRAAARSRGLTYDAESKVYRDQDGFAVLDKYGQSRE